MTVFTRRCFARRRPRERAGVDRHRRRRHPTRHDTGSEIWHVCGPHFLRHAEARFGAAVAAQRQHVEIASESLHARSRRRRSAGQTRMTVSLCVILLEMTEVVSVLPFVMLAVIVAKGTADRLGDSTILRRIKLKNLPFMARLPHLSVRRYQVTADDVCKTRQHPVLPKCASARAHFAAPLSPPPSTPAPPRAQPRPGVTAHRRMTRRSQRDNISWRGAVLALAERSHTAPCVRADMRSRRLTVGAVRAKARASALTSPPCSHTVLAHPPAGGGRGGGSACHFSRARRCSLTPVHACARPQGRGRGPCEAAPGGGADAGCVCRGRVLRVGLLQRQLRPVVRPVRVRNGAARPHGALPQLRPPGRSARQPPLHGVRHHGHLGAVQGFRFLQYTS